MKSFEELGLNERILQAIGGTSTAWSAIAILLLLAVAILWWYAIGSRKESIPQSATNTDNTSQETLQ